MWWLRGTIYSLKLDEIHKVEIWLIKSEVIKCDQNKNKWEHWGNPKAMEMQIMSDTNI